MTDHNDSSVLPERPTPRSTVSPRGVAVLLIVVGAVFSAMGLFADEGPSRFGFGYLWAFAFGWSIVLGSLFFVALQHVTHSVWSVVIRRVAEMFASPMWLIAVLFIPVLLFAIFNDSFGIFPWLDPAVVEGDHLLEEKEPYLNLPFFGVRAGVFFLVWMAFTAFFIRRSTQQDSGEMDVSKTRAMRRAAAPFMLIFALTVTFASFDWFMSLEPHWFSTILGVYVFSGMTLAALAAITIAVIWMRGRGMLGDGIVTGDHLYSLGALLFAFTCFWAYIAFSQYMLIWYANIPEETLWYDHRLGHGWLVVTLVLAALRFFLPFALLLSREAKMNPRLLVATSVLVLIGELVDLYWLIMPQLHHDGPVLSWQELGPVLLLSGVLIIFVMRFLVRHRPLPVGDPLLQESRDFHL